MPDPGLTASPPHSHWSHSWLPRPAAALIRTVRASFDIRKILLAAAGLLCAWAGIVTLERVLGPLPTPWLDPHPVSLDTPWSLETARAAATRIAAPTREILAPAFLLLQSPDAPATLPRALLALLWYILVWTIFGAAIGRIAAVEYATHERPGFLSALRFAIVRKWSLWIPPLSPLLFIALLAIPGLLIGLLARVLPNFAGVLLAFPLLCAIPMALALLGLAAGWPLMTMTIAVEDEDAFDALSRSYSYVRIGLVRGILATLALWAAGAAALPLVELFAHAVLKLGLGPAQLAAGLSGRQNLFPANQAWTAAAHFLTRAWAYAFLWTAAATLYLSLRHEVDGVDLHEVAGLDNTPDEPFDPADTPTAITPA